MLPPKPKQIVGRFGLATGAGGGRGDGCSVVCANAVAGGVSARSSEVTLNKISLRDHQYCSS